MENKELYINTLCFAVVFIPFITALVVHNSIIYG